MASKVKKALENTLGRLDFGERRMLLDELLKRKKLTTWISVRQSPAEIADLLVSSLTEDGALAAVAEGLNVIGCRDDARRLKSEASEHFSKEQFLREYKAGLVLRVRNVDPLLDELLAKGVLQQERYHEIKALSMPEEKMMEIFESLKTAGAGGNDVFYDTLEKLEPDLMKHIHVPCAQVECGEETTLVDWRKLEMIINTLQSEASASATMATGSEMSPKEVWVRLEPEMDCMYGDGTATYSLQSEAGHFECSVSGLRWVCKQKVRLKYEFGSWDEHIGKLETWQYMAAGPLLDITVISGKLDEVYLPHWIYTDDNPVILDKFAVLHVDTHFDAVEKVSEVTPSHVKLSETIFSPRGVLMKAGFPVKINCKVLIYKTNKTFLTLHVYLIPPDPALQQTIKNKELSNGNKMIQKPYPDQPLKMRDRFILTTDKDNAEIYPDKLKLVYESSDPNFFEVFIKNPDNDVQLTLRHESTSVWTCAIRKDDYQNTGDFKGIYDKELASVRTKLVDRLSREVINQLLDDLLGDGVLNYEEKDSVLQGNQTSADRARCLIDMVKKKGSKASRRLFTHLRRRDPTLCGELRLHSGLPLEGWASDDELERI